MGINGKRRVIRINENTLVLADTMFEKGEKVTKRRLVKLYPERLFWTNTRLSVDGRYSQFLYKIVPEGDSHSRLDFIGSQIYYGSAKPSQAEMDRASQELAECDSSIWRYLATAMEKDLGRSKSVTLFMRPKMIKVR